MSPRLGKLSPERAPTSGTLRRSSASNITCHSLDRTDLGITFIKCFCSSMAFSYLLPGYKYLRSLSRGIPYWHLVVRSIFASHTSAHCSTFINILLYIYDGLSYHSIQTYFPKTLKTSKQNPKNFSRTQTGTIRATFGKLSTRCSISAYPALRAEG